MRFDWSNFTEEKYDGMLKAEVDYRDYIGSVHIGDICIEIVNGFAGTWIYDEYNPVDVVMFNFYVAHEDTGYGYKDNVLPYDYADGFEMKMPYNLSYDEFKTKTEKMIMEYIEAYKGAYSLVEHANRPLEIW